MPDSHAVLRGVMKRVAHVVAIPALLVLLASTALAQSDSSPPAGDGVQVRLPGMKSITFSGQYRLRYENFYNYDFDRDAGDQTDWFTQRFRFNVGAEITDNLRAYVELQDVRAWGEESSTTDASADNFDAHQAYFEMLKTPWLGGSTRIGRQELAYGDERIIGALDWAMQARAFDGIRQRWSSENSSDLDVFFTQIRETWRTTTPVYDDAFFGGVYWAQTRESAPNFDAYLLFLQDDETAAGDVESRGTLGGRFHSAPSRFEFEVEFATQFGEDDSADIPIFECWAAHAHVTMHFSDDRKGAWLKLEGNAATGDDPDTADDERFNNLFPTGHKHWGMMDFAFWENMMHGMVEFGLVPGPRSSLSFTYSYFRSMEETDVFRGPQNTLAGAPSGTSNSIGSELDILYKVNFDTEPARTFFHAGYGVFVPGSGAKAVSADDDLAHYFYLQTGLSF